MRQSDNGTIVLRGGFGSITCEIYTQEKEIECELMRSVIDLVVLVNTDLPPLIVIQVLRDLKLEPKFVSINLQELLSMLEDVDECLLAAAFFAEIDRHGIYSCEEAFECLLAYVFTLTNNHSLKIDFELTRSICKEYKISWLKFNGQIHKHLGVFYTQYHPAQINTNNKAKAGLSYFSLFSHFCSGPLGKSTLEKMLKRPLANLLAIQSRFLAICKFDDCHLPLLNKLEQSIKKYIGFGSLVRKMLNEKFTYEDFYKFAENITVVQSVLDCFDQIYSDASGKMLKLFWHIADKIGGLIQSKFDVRFKAGLKSGINEELDTLKEIYDKLGYYLEHLQNQEMERLSQIGVEFQNLSILCVPEIGYLLSVTFDVPPTDENQDQPDRRRQVEQFRAAQSIDGWELVMQKGNVCFYKSKLTAELDEKIGDVRTQLFEQEKLVLLAAQNELLSYQSFLDYFDIKVSQVDAFLAIYKAMKFYDLTFPVLTNQTDFHCLVIKDARYLFTQIVNQKFVPFSFCSVDEFTLNNIHADSGKDMLAPGKLNKINIITGPNNSGKTLFVKTVASLVYLAQCGFPVPARAYIAKILNQLFILASEPTSIANINSSLNGSLELLDEAMRYSDENSLVIFDEYLNNTPTQLSNAMVISIVEYYERKFDADSRTKVFAIPLIFMATHNLELLSKGLIKESSLVRFFRTKSLIEVEGNVYDTVDQFENMMHALQSSIERTGDYRKLESVRVLHLYKMVPGFVSNNFGMFIFTDDGLANTDFLIQFIKSRIQRDNFALSQRVARVTKENSEAFRNVVLKDFLEMIDLLI